MVNGDKPVFRFIGNILYACGTPWQGKEEMGSNIIRPVRAVCFLEQSPENHIRPLKEQEVIRHIFHQILIPKETADFERFWALLERMVTTVPFYLLECNREPAAARLAYETMRKGRCNGLPLREQFFRQADSDSG